MRWQMLAFGLFLFSTLILADSTPTASAPSFYVFAENQLVAVNEGSFGYSFKLEPDGNKFKLTIFSDNEGRTPKAIKHFSDSAAAGADKFYTGFLMPELGGAQRTACLAPLGKPDNTHNAFVLVTFDASIVKNNNYADSPVGGVCSPGSVSFNGQLINDLKTLTTQEKYAGFKITLLPLSSPLLEFTFKFTDGKEKSFPDKKVTKDSPAGENYSSIRGNGLKGKSYVYAAIVQDFFPDRNVASFFPRLWFREELVQQDLVDLFVIPSEYRTAAQAKQKSFQLPTGESEDVDFEKPFALKEPQYYTFSGKEFKVCYRFNTEIAEGAEIKLHEGGGNGALKDDSTPLSGSEDKADRCKQKFDELVKQNKMNSSVISSDFLLVKLTKPYDAKSTNVYGVIAKAEVKNNLANAFADNEKKYAKQARRTLVKVVQPFKGLQSKKEARILFVVNPVSEDEKKAYEKNSKGKKAYESIDSGKKTYGAILYVDQKTLNKAYNLGSAVFPESFPRLGWKSEQITKDGGESWVELYIPEFDTSSDAYTAFVGLEFVKLLEENVGQNVEGYWGSPTTVESLSKAPRAFSPIREYEKVCGLGADVVEFFECKNLNWEKQKPSKDMDFSGFVQADDETIKKRKEKTIEEFQQESCGGSKKIYINHANEIGFYKTPRFYTLWKNFVDSQGEFLKYVGNGKLKVRVRPLRLYNKDAAKKDEEAQKKLQETLRKYGGRLTAQQREQLLADAGRLFLLNSPFAYLPFYSFTYAFHRLAKDAKLKETDGLILLQNGRIEAWTLASERSNLGDEKKHLKDTKVELLKQYLFPVPPKANDKPLDLAYVDLYKKAAFDESYEDVAAVLEIRVPEKKLGMQLSGYVYASSVEVPKSADASKGKKKMQEGFLTQTDCVSGRPIEDVETGKFERKDPMTKKGCINLPLYDAIKSLEASKKVKDGRSAYELVKACRAILPYYNQDFGITEQAKAKKGEAKNKIVLNALDLSKKYLYDLTLCPSKADCEASELIKASELVEPSAAGEVTWPPAEPRTPATFTPAPTPTPTSTPASTPTPTPTFTPTITPTTTSTLTEPRTTTARVREPPTDSQRMGDVAQGVTLTTRGYRPVGTPLGRGYSYSFGLPPDSPYLLSGITSGGYYPFQTTQLFGPTGPLAQYQLGTPYTLWNAPYYYNYPLLTALYADGWNFGFRDPRSGWFAGALGSNGFMALGGPLQIKLGNVNLGIPLLGVTFSSLNFTFKLDKLEPGQELEFVVIPPEGVELTDEQLAAAPEPVIEVDSVVPVEQPRVLKPGEVIEEQQPWPAYVFVFVVLVGVFVYWLAFRRK